MSLPNPPDVPTTVHSHITDAIRAPSLIRLSDNVVLLRFETLKIYAALGAVRALLADGTIRPGDTLVDSSSGIYALALAMVCHRYDLRCHIIASTTVTPAIRAQLEILGATVDQMPAEHDLRLDQNRRVERVRQLLRANPGMHWMRQYHDPVHYLGYAELADLVRAALPDTRLAVVSSVGTGASSGGLIQPLRVHDPATPLVGIQPFGSVSFGGERFQDPEAIIAGIGSAIPFDNVRHDLYDQIHWLTFRYAMAGAIGLMRDHAVFAGLSTGAAYLAAAWTARRDPGRTHLVVGADTGHRYVERVFARYPDALDPDTLKPMEIDSLDGLAPPWSVMHWRRQPRAQHS
ncbi:pyridoxal-phosphate dependent enzyme [Micromonospora antibiotica]|uniref:Pyridoxal-phosphate dependent enzyme n=1 Tax=Micromonospora antibiotica TaxID=2807623 RepID=A0ABS3V6R2_9ACTN|nr:pyridoxal-phosphate dependent enzyme [Micromonospora antibiotica]MBO4161264.1 pyridoxal-phosphate dependent enzyme [Micromonospora antibiotica]